MINIPALKSGLLYAYNEGLFIPVMTDYSLPSGLVTVSSSGSIGYPGWKAFLGHDPVFDELWTSQNPTSINEWIQYTFDVSKRVNGMSAMFLYSNVSGFTVLFQYSTDNTTWNTVQTLVEHGQSSEQSLIEVGVPGMPDYLSFPTINARYWRWYCPDSTTYLQATYLQLYGYL